jgi:hypothetical protein
MSAALSCGRCRATAGPTGAGAAGRAASAFAPECEAQAGTVSAPNIRQDPRKVRTMLEHSASKQRFHFWAQRRLVSGRPRAKMSRRSPPRHPRLRQRTLRSCAASGGVRQARAPLDSVAVTEAHGCVPDGNVAEAVGTPGISASRRRCSSFSAVLAAVSERSGRRRVILLSKLGTWARLRALDGERREARETWPARRL